MWTLYLISDQVKILQSISYISWNFLLFVTSYVALNAPLYYTDAIIWRLLKIIKASQAQRQQGAVTHQRVVSQVDDL